MTRLSRGSIVVQQTVYRHTDKVVQPPSLSPHRRCETHAETFMRPISHHCRFFGRLLKTFFFWVLMHGSIRDFGDVSCLHSHLNCTTLQCTYLQYSHLYCVEVRLACHHLRLPFEQTKPAMHKVSYVKLTQNQPNVWTFQAQLLQKLHEIASKVLVIWQYIVFCCCSFARIFMR